MNPFAYSGYQAMADLTLPMRHAAALLNHALDAWPFLADTPRGRSLRATCDLVALSALTHSRRPFAIDSVEMDGKSVPVTEEITQATPFCSLLHFAKEGAPRQPRVLVIAPMSGHFATLLRGTVRTLLPDHDVYITDWINPRDVPLMQGRFGFDEFDLAVGVAKLGELGLEQGVIARIVHQPKMILKLRIKTDD